MRRASARPVRRLRQAFQGAGRLATTIPLPAGTDTQRCAANGTGCCAGLAGAEGGGPARRRLLQACFSLGGPLLPPRCLPSLGNRVCCVSNPNGPGASYGSCSDPGDSVKICPDSAPFAACCS